MRKIYRFVSLIFCWFTEVTQGVLEYARGNLREIAKISAAKMCIQLMSALPKNLSIDRFLGRRRKCETFAEQVFISADLCAAIGGMDQNM